MNEDKSVHELSGLEYTEKSDFGQSPILVIEQRRRVPTIRVFADKQGELFVMLYGVAGNCGFSSWTNKPFVEAIRRLGVEVYRNTDNGAFAVKVIDVVTIAEELLTLPREESLVTVDDAFAIITSKTNKFLDWWNGKALAAIEKQAHRIPAPKITLPPAETKKEVNAVTTEENDAIPRSSFIGIDMEWLSWQIERLISAGLPLELAIKVAVNLRNDYNTTKTHMEAHAAVVDFIKLINPSVEINER